MIVVVMFLLYYYTYYIQQTSTTKFHATRYNVITTVVAIAKKNFLCDLPWKVFED
jgi:hypothetical protein